MKLQLDLHVRAREKVSHGGGVFNAGVGVIEWVPQVAVLRDLCPRASPSAESAQVCEYADLWHPIDVSWYDSIVELGPHRRKMRRVEEVGHARFLTFSCHRRLPLLNHVAIRMLFLERLTLVKQQQCVRLLAWVIMPEHVHLLVYPDAAPDLTRFSHALKRPFAEAVLSRWKQLDAAILSKIRHGAGFRYWQTGGGYDRNLFTEQQVLEKVNYIHENPVRRKLVATVTDYPWSSARWYAGLADAKLPCDPMPF